MTSNALVPIYDKVPNVVEFCTNTQMVTAAAAMTGCTLHQAPAVLMTCLQNNMTLLDYLRNFHTVEGRPTKRADAMLADYDNTVGRHEIIECTAERNVIKFIPKEGPESTWTLTIEEAVEAEWPLGKADKEGKRPWKTNWSSPVKRADMLHCRNLSRAIRKLAPKIVAGLYTPEEIQDSTIVDAEVVSVTRTKRGTNGKAAPVNRISDAIAAVEQPPFDTPAESTDANVVDAKFTVTDEPQVPQQPQQPQAAESGGASTGQVLRLTALRAELDMPLDTWESALAARGVKTAHGLTTQQAQELIDKLEARKQQLASAKN